MGKKLWKLLLVGFAAIIGLTGIGIGIFALTGGFEQKVVGMTAIYFESQDVTEKQMVIEDDITLTINYLPSNATDILLTSDYDGNVVEVPKTIRAGQEFTIKVKKDANGRNVGGSADIKFFSGNTTSESNLVTPCRLKLVVDVPVVNDDLVFTSTLEYIASSTSGNIYIISKNKDNTIFYLDSNKENVFDTNIWNTVDTRDTYLYYETKVNNTNVTKKIDVRSTPFENSALPNAPVEAYYNDVTNQYELKFYPGEIEDSNIRILAKTHRTIAIQSEFINSGFEDLENVYLKRTYEALSNDESFKSLLSKFATFLDKYHTNYFINNNSTANDFFNSLKYGSENITFDITDGTNLKKNIETALSYVYATKYIDFYVSDVKVDYFRVTEDVVEFDLVTRSNGTKTRVDSYSMITDGSSLSLMSLFEIELGATSYDKNTTQEIEETAKRNLLKNNVSIQVLVYDKSTRSKVDKVSIKTNSNSFIDNTQTNFNTLSWQNLFSFDRVRGEEDYTTLDALLGDSGTSIFGENAQYMTVDYNETTGEWDFTKLIPTKSSEFELLLLFTLQAADEDGQKNFYDFARVTIKENSSTSQDGVDRNRNLEYAKTMFKQTDNQDVIEAYKNNNTTDIVLGSQKIVSNPTISSDYVDFNSFKLFAYVYTSFYYEKDKVWSRSYGNQSLTNLFSDFNYNGKCYSYDILNVGDTNTLYRFTNLDEMFMVDKYGDLEFQEKEVNEDFLVDYAIYAYEITNENWEIFAEHASSNEVGIFGCYVLTDKDGNPVNREGVRLFDDEGKPVDKNGQRIINDDGSINENAVMDTYNFAEKDVYVNKNIVTYVALNSFNLDNTIKVESILEDIYYYSDINENIEVLDSEGNPSKVVVGYDADKVPQYENISVYTRNRSALESENILNTLKLIAGNEYENILYVSPFNPEDIIELSSLHNDESELIDPLNHRKFELHIKLTDQLRAWKYALSKYGIEGNLNFEIGYFEDDKFISVNKYSDISTVYTQSLIDYLANDRIITTNPPVSIYSIMLSITANESNVDDNKSLIVNISEGYRNNAIYAPNDVVDVKINTIKVDNINTMFGYTEDVNNNGIQNNPLNSANYSAILNMNAKLNADGDWENSWDNSMYDSIYKLSRIFEIDSDNLINIEDLINKRDQNGNLITNITTNILSGIDLKFDDVNDVYNTSINKNNYSGILDFTISTKENLTKYFLLYLFNLEEYDTFAKYEQLINIYNATDPKDSQSGASIKINLVDEYKVINPSGNFADLTENDKLVFAANILKLRLGINKPDLAQTSTDYERLVRCLEIMCKLYINVQEYNKDKPKTVQQTVNGQTIDVVYDRIVYDIYNFENLRYSSIVEETNVDKNAYVDVYGIYTEEDFINLFEAIAKNVQSFKETYFAIGKKYNTSLELAISNILDSHKPVILYGYNIKNNTNYDDFSDISALVGGTEAQKLLYNDYILQYLLVEYYKDVNNDIFDDFYNMVKGTYNTNYKSVSDFMNGYGVECSVSVDEFSQFFDSYSTKREKNGIEYLAVKLNYAGYLPLSSLIDKIIIDYNMQWTFGDISAKEGESTRKDIVFAYEVIAQFEQPVVSVNTAVTPIYDETGALLQTISDTHKTNTNNGVDLRYVDLYDIINFETTDQNGNVVNINKAVTFEIDNLDYGWFKNDSKSISNIESDLYLFFFDSFKERILTVTASVGSQTFKIKFTIKPNLTQTDEIVDSYAFTSISNLDGVVSEKTYDLDELISFDKTVPTGNTSPDVKPTFAIKHLYAKNWHNGNWQEITKTSVDAGIKYFILDENTGNKVCIDSNTNELKIFGNYFIELKLVFKIDGLSNTRVTSDGLKNELEDYTITIYPEKKLYSGNYANPSRYVSNPVGNVYTVAGNLGASTPYQNGSSVYNSMFSFTQLNTTSSIDPTNNCWLESKQVYSAYDPVVNEWTSINLDKEYFVNYESLQSLTWNNGTAGTVIYDQFFDKKDDIRVASILNKFLDGSTTIIDKFGNNVEVRNFGINNGILNVNPYNTSFLLPLKLSIKNGYMTAGNEIIMIIPIAGYSISVNNNLGNKSNAEFVYDEYTDSYKFDLPTIYLEAGNVYELKDYISISYASNTASLFSVNFAQSVLLPICEDKTFMTEVIGVETVYVNPVANIVAEGTSIEINQVIRKGDATDTLEFDVNIARLSNGGNDYTSLNNVVTVPIGVLKNISFDLGDYFVVIDNDCFPSEIEGENQIIVENGSPLDVFLGTLESYLMTTHMGFNWQEKVSYVDAYVPNQTDYRQLVFKFGSNYSITLDFDKDCINHIMQKILFTNPDEVVKATITFSNGTESMTLDQMLYFKSTKYVQNIVFNVEKNIFVENGTTLDYYLRTNLLLQDNYKEDAVKVLDDKTVVYGDFDFDPSNIQYKNGTIDIDYYKELNIDKNYILIMYKSSCIDLDLTHTGNSIFTFGSFGTGNEVNYEIYISMLNQVLPGLTITPTAPVVRATSISVENLSRVANLYTALLHSLTEYGTFSVSANSISYGNESLTFIDSSNNPVNCLKEMQDENGLTYFIFNFTSTDAIIAKFTAPGIEQNITITPVLTVNNNLFNLEDTNVESGYSLKKFLEDYGFSFGLSDITVNGNRVIHNSLNMTITFNNIYLVETKDSDRNVDYMLIFKAGEDASISIEILNTAPIANNVLFGIVNINIVVTPNITLDFESLHGDKKIENGSNIYAYFKSINLTDYVLDETNTDESNNIIVFVSTNLNRKFIIKLDSNCKLINGVFTSTVYNPIIHITLIDTDNNINLIDADVKFEVKFAIKTDTFGLTNISNVENGVTVSEMLSKYITINNDTILNINGNEITYIYTDGRVVTINFSSLDQSQGVTITNDKRLLFNNDTNEITMTIKVTANEFSGNMDVVKELKFIPVINIISSAFQTKTLENGADLETVIKKFYNNYDNFGLSAINEVELKDSSNNILAKLIFKNITIAQKPNTNKYFLIADETASKYSVDISINASHTQFDFDLSVNKTIKEDILENVNNNIEITLENGSSVTNLILSLFNIANHDELLSTYAKDIDYTNNKITLKATDNSRTIVITAVNLSIYNYNNSHEILLVINDQMQSGFNISVYYGVDADLANLNKIVDMDFEVLANITIKSSTFQITNTINVHNGVKYTEFIENYVDNSKSFHIVFGSNCLSYSDCILFDEEVQTSLTISVLDTNSNVITSVILNLLPEITVKSSAISAQNITVDNGVGVSSIYSSYFDITGYNLPAVYTESVAGEGINIATFTNSTDATKKLILTFVGCELYGSNYQILFDDSIDHKINVKIEENGVEMINVNLTLSARIVIKSSTFKLTELTVYNGITIADFENSIVTTNNFLTPCTIDYGTNNIDPNNETHLIFTNTNSFNITITVKNSSGTLLVQHVLTIKPDMTVKSELFQSEPVSITSGVNIIDFVTTNFLLTNPAGVGITSEDSKTIKVTDDKEFIIKFTSDCIISTTDGSGATVYQISSNYTIENELVEVSIGGYTISFNIKINVVAS